MWGFLEDFWDEFTDFFEDFWEHLSRKPARDMKTKYAIIGGVKVAVRPAYFFAERVDNTIKILFGLSIAISAFTATFLGFASLSDLVDFLISSFWGRAAMFFIGVSYLTIAFWKLLHLSYPEKSY